MPLKIEIHIDHFVSQLCKGILKLSEPLPQETEKWKFQFNYSLLKWRSKFKSLKWTNLIPIIAICSSFCKCKSRQDCQKLQQFLNIIIQQGIQEWRHQHFNNICGMWYKFFWIFFFGWGGVYIRLLKLMRLNYILGLGIAKKLCALVF